MMDDIIKTLLVALFSDIDSTNHEEYNHAFGLQKIINYFNKDINLDIFRGNKDDMFIEEPMKLIHQKLGLVGNKHSEKEYMDNILKEKVAKHLKFANTWEIGTCGVIKYNEESKKWTEPTTCLKIRGLYDFIKFNSTLNSYLCCYCFKEGHKPSYEHFMDNHDIYNGSLVSFQWKQVISPDEFTNICAKIIGFLFCYDESIPSELYDNITGVLVKEKKEKNNTIKIVEFWLLNDLHDQLKGTMENLFASTPNMMPTNVVNKPWNKKNM